MASTDSGSIATGIDPAWVGCDVSARTFALAIDFPRMPGKPPADVDSLATATFDRTREGAGKAITWIDQQLEQADGLAGRPVRLVMESTGTYSLELIMWLIELRPACAPAMVNGGRASEFIRSLGQRCTDDLSDARGLARLGSDRWPAPYDPPCPVRRELRDILRLRVSLINDRTAHTSRLGQAVDTGFAHKILENQIRQINKDIERIEKRARQLLRKLPRLEADVETIDGIYGIGFITAATVIAELGDLRRFKDARQLSAFAGLSPGRKDSGTSVRKKIPCKCGPPTLRRTLYMAAHTVVKGDNDLADLYRQKTEKGMRPNKALMIVMRKLLLIMRAMLVFGTDYEPHRACG